MKFYLEEINRLKKADFEEVFKNVVECCPEISQTVSSMLPFPTFSALLNAFMETLDKMDHITSEQSTIGLNRITNEEKRIILKEQIEAYWEKFNFPFVICVRECKTIDDIIESVRERLSRTPDEEIRVAFEHVKKITSFRISDMVSH
uniref:2-oxo-4-hydroxy-4-carboxy-5-ureidoimidazoline decarboxylase n=1 Tax=Lutzomyia longipalpis TaxID=7200 RepID=A0A1B0CJK1_LUTLO